MKKIYNQPESQISELMPLNSLLAGSIPDGGDKDDIWGD